MGVGLPMIAVPLMSFVLPPYVAAALVVLPVFPANIVQLRTGGSLRQKFTRFWPLIAGVVSGVFIGAPFLLAANLQVLQFIVASIVALYALTRIRDTAYVIRPDHEKSAGLTFGLLSGAIGGLTMLIGPLITLYMAALKLPRDVFVGSIALVYLFTTFAIGVALAAYDQLTTALIIASLVACVPATLGVVAGSICRQHVSQRIFDKLLTTLLFAISVAMFYRAL